MKYHFIVVVEGVAMQAQVAEKIESFFSAYKLRSYRKGQIIIYSGDDTNYIYQIKKGRVKQYDVTYRGDEIILNVFKPPAFFPMSLAINKTANLYFYSTETVTEMRPVPVNEVIEFLELNPDVVFDLLSRVYRGADGLLGRIAHLMSSSAKSRLLYELIIATRRFGHQQEGCSFLLDVNESEIAARAGLSRETVNREINKLKKSNLVEIKHGKISITNLKELEKRIGKSI